MENLIKMDDLGVPLFLETPNLLFHLYYVSRLALSTRNEPFDIMNDPSIINIAFVTTMIPSKKKTAKLSLLHGSLWPYAILTLSPTIMFHWKITLTERTRILEIHPFSTEP